jgi:hypothetical protein
MEKPVVRENAPDKEVHAGPCYKCSLAPSCDTENVTCKGYRYFLNTEESKFNALEAHQGRGRDFKDIPAVDDW